MGMYGFLYSPPYLTALPFVLRSRRFSPQDAHAHASPSRAKRNRPFTVRAVNWRAAEDTEQAILRGVAIALRLGIGLAVDEGVRRTGLGPGIGRVGYPGPG